MTSREQVLPSQPPPSDPRRWLLLVGALFATSSLGAALAPYLAVHQPLLLLALNPWPRHMLLVAPVLPLAPFMFVATSRALLSCAVGFEVGKRYGTAGLAMFEARSKRLGQWVSVVERAFQRAAFPLLVVAPGPLTAALAGMGGVRRGVAFPALLLGQTLWVYLTYRLGDVLSPWTTPILHFMQRYLLETTAACAVSVLVYQWLSRRRRQRKHDATQRTDTGA